MKMVLYGFVIVQPKTVAMETDGILDIVSIESVSIAQHKFQVATLPQPSKPNDKIHALNDENLSTADKLKAAEQDEDDCVVNKIVRHTIENDEVL